MQKAKRTRYSRTVDRRLFEHAVNDGSGGLVFAPLYYWQHYQLSKHRSAKAMCHYGLLHGWLDWPTYGDNPPSVRMRDRLADTLNISTIVDPTWRRVWRNTAIDERSLVELCPHKTATYWQRSQ